MKPRNKFTSPEHRYSLGYDEDSGVHFASLPVSSGVVDYEEYYLLSDAAFARLLADFRLAAAFM